MAAFEHVLLTRFNVRGFGYEGVDDAWLDHRFDLFDRYCFPSVRAQSRPPDRWLVLFDEATPARFRERIAVYAEWKPFLPCYVDDRFDRLDLPALVRDRVRPSAGHLITSRVDNDDALAIRFLETVQSTFTGQRLCFVNLDRGYILAESRLYATCQRSNPFISLIENAEGLRTVWCDEHNRLGHVGPLIRIDTEPMWIQTVHQRNVSNQVGLALRVPRRRLSGRFVLNDRRLDDDPESRLGVLAEYLATRGRRLGRRLRRAASRAPDGRTGAR
jgi:hypothetical protein